MKANKMNVVNQINAMSKIQQKQFKTFFTNWVIQYIDFDMHSMAGDQYYYELEFGYIYILDKVIEFMNNRIDKKMSKQHRKFVKILNRCNNFDDLIQFVEYDDALQVYLSLRDELFDPNIVC